MRLRVWASQLALFASATPASDAAATSDAALVLRKGLRDFHVHVFSTPGDEDFALALYILNGITGVRDAGGLRPLPEPRRVAASIERGGRGERVGARLVSARALIDGPPGSRARSDGGPELPRRAATRA